MPRSIKVLEVFNKELGRLPFPAIYVLFESKTKAYIGEAKDIYSRLCTHTAHPEDKIAKWKSSIIINDGRPAAQSDFNDAVIRKSLELYLIRLFKANKYEIVAQGEPQNLNPAQKYIVESLLEELNYFLMKKNLIYKVLEERGEEEIFSDELIRILQKKRCAVKNLGKYEGWIDNKKVFVRPGSKKPKGWQITFRGRKPGSFIDSLVKGNGYLLVSRNGVLLIPLTVVQQAIPDKRVYDQDTIDIWILFSEDIITLRYKDNVIDVSQYNLSR